MTEENDYESYVEDDDEDDIQPGGYTILVGPGRVEPHTNPSRDMVASLPHLEVQPTCGICTDMIKTGECSVVCMFLSLLSHLLPHLFHS